MPQDIDASKLVIETTKSPKPLKSSNELIFGQTFSGKLLCFFRLVAQCSSS